ncbi:MAG: 23S rRNA (adenine(2503)-C(2))-methyltransferase RlmN [Saprospiraceae bacterium]|nr:23S rRNA (adenine(2503)-C(2))-methyltransferase RlmN [Saprospiraceae bacterium]
MTASTSKDIRQISKQDLLDYCSSQGLPSFRANQMWEWIWKKGVTRFDDMRNVPKDLRSKLSEDFHFQGVELDKVQKSMDGTIKSRLKLHDGHMIEAVLIPVPKDKRFTVCVSSQVGCSLSCSFCATGKMKRMRNLDPAEIYDQVVIVNKQCQEHFDANLTNIVFMGMGEPLLAYNNVLKGIEHITSEYGLHMSPRRITVSTVGIEKMIRKLADDGVRFNLALSLHAAIDEKRDQIMPINETNNLDALMLALKYFYNTTNNRISYEYIAFEGFNDGIEDARALYHLCRDFPVRINIIEYNPVEGVPYVKSPEDRIDAFARYLTDKGVMVTLRRSRGKDIDAACGQLANKG